MNAVRFIVFDILLAICLTQTVIGQAQGDETPVQTTASLHVLIDQHLQPVTGLVTARCTEAEFLRRVSLDLVGMPPTADDARAFLADTGADKHALLVERLMMSPHFARNLTSMLDLTLMERRANTHVTADDWQAWLLKSVRENKPWNVLAREILQADGDDPALRPAARFSLDRASEPNLLTHDISRIFFGRDMQCAQCHDHPIVADYLQSDYHGLLAYVAPGYAVVRKEGDKQMTLHAERAGSDLSFESVFVKGTQHRTGPRMPDDIAIDEPFLLPGDEYQVAPADNVKAIPKFSRRSRLAEFATNGNNRAFNENIANRLWAHMFGRGLVHPLDLHHPDNPAADPELLKLLGEQFALMNFDMRAFLREIALSQVYQRSFDVPVDLTAVADQSVAQIPALEQQHAALQAKATESANAYSTALEEWHNAEAAMLPAAGELDTARNAYAEAKKKADEAAKALADVTAQMQSKQTVSAALNDAAAAVRRAADALPGEKELPDSARILAAKAEQVTTEAVALTKSIEEKDAAHKPLAEALVTAMPPIDAAVEKMDPLRVTMTQAELVMLTARRHSATDSQAALALNQRLETARQFSKLATLKQTLATADAAMPFREAELGAAQSEMNSSAAEMTDRLTKDFTVTSLKPLTPEQLCWSVFQVTGVYGRYWQAEVAELDKSAPLTDEQKQDAAVIAARNVELEQKTFDKLKGNLGTFVTFYGAAAGQPQGDFFSTADQALFTANGGSINSWVAPASDNVTDRVIKQTDPRIAGEELYLAVLTRMPTEEEVADVTTYLIDRAADRNVAAQELVWALLNSAEFRFNH